jgi:peptide/nickel transport system ATP-binding protein
MPSRDLARYRGRVVSMVLQDPGLAFDPVYRIGDQIAEAVARHDSVTFAQERARALKLFERVRIPSPERRLDNYPHEMSGGMRRRAMVALACRPKVLLADEPPLRSMPPSRSRCCCCCANYNANWALQ